MIDVNEGMELGRNLRTVVQGREVRALFMQKWAYHTQALLLNKVLLFMIKRSTPGVRFAPRAHREAAWITWVTRGLSLRKDR